MGEWAGTRLHSPVQLGGGEDMERAVHRATAALAWSHLLVASAGRCRGQGASCLHMAKASGGHREGRSAFWYLP